MRRSGRPTPSWLLLGSALLPLILPTPVPAAERDDVYISFYALGAVVDNRTVRYQGTDASTSVLTNGAGGGLKAGLFPAVTRRIVGIEFEYTIHGGGIEFQTTVGSGPLRGNADLLVMSSMVNLLVRYPGRTFIPYWGIGGGLSQGILTGAEIPGRLNRGWETAPALAHQWLVGVQGNLTTRTFLFGEYRYVIADYHWAKLALDFRAQYLVAGIGIRF